MMRVFLFCSFVFAAAGCAEQTVCSTDADCSDGFTCNLANNSCSTDASVWEIAVDEFISSTCSIGAACFGDDEASCKDEIAADMEDARALLEDAAEDLCINCMKVKSQFSRIMEAAQCKEESVSVVDVLAVCDTDSNVDADGDGDPTNDFDEACANFP